MIIKSQKENIAHLGQQKRKYPISRKPYRICVFVTEDSQNHIHKNDSISKKLSMLYISSLLGLTSVSGCNYHPELMLQRNILNQLLD